MFEAGLVHRRLFPKANETKNLSHFRFFHPLPSISSPTLPFSSSNWIWRSSYHSGVQVTVLTTTDFGAFLTQHLQQ